MALEKFNLNDPTIASEIDGTIITDSETAIEVGNFSTAYANGNIRSNQVNLTWTASTEEHFLGYKIIRAAGYDFTGSNLSEGFESGVISSEWTIGRIDNNYQDVDTTYWPAPEFDPEINEIVQLESEDATGWTVINFNSENWQLQNNANSAYSLYGGGGYLDTLTLTKTIYARKFTPLTISFNHFITSGSGDFLINGEVVASYTSLGELNQWNSYEYNVTTSSSGNATLLEWKYYTHNGGHVYLDEIKCGDLEVEDLEYTLVETFNDNDSTSFVDTELQSDTYYTYKVATVLEYGTSLADHIIVKTPKWDHPQILGHTELSTGSILLEWADNSESESSFDIVIAYIDSDTQEEAKVSFTAAANDTTKTIDFLSPSTAYNINVNAKTDWETTECLIENACVYSNLNDLAEYYESFSANGLPSGYSTADWTLTSNPDIDTDDGYCMSATGENNEELTLQKSITVESGTSITFSFAHKESRIEGNGSLIFKVYDGYDVVVSEASITTGDVWGGLTPFNYYNVDNAELTLEWTYTSVNGSTIHLDNIQVNW